MDSGIHLQNTFKTYTYDLDKCVPPSETIANVQGKLHEIGIDLLQNLVRIDTGRLGIPVYASLCGAEALRMIGTKKQMGKGCTPEQAQASALMELVERFSFFSFIRGSSLTKVAYHNVKGEALSLDYIPLSVYDPEPSDERNRTCFEGLPLSWVPAFDLIGEKDILLPIDWFYLIHEYNGPAAGNSQEEALLQGLCEVVERHVSSIITHEKRRTPRITPDSVKDPAGRELLRKFDRNGIKFYLKDFSLNTGIPTVGAHAYDPSTFPDSSEIIFTAGTTTSPEKSLIRALTEVAQLAGDFNHRTSYRPTLPKFKDLEEASYITASTESIDLHSLPDLSNTNFRREIFSSAAALKGIGLNAFAVEMTHPQIRTPVVYVIIPGAHFMDRTRGNRISYHASRLASHLSDEEEATAEMKRIVELFPERYEVHFFLGYVYERKGWTKEALAHFEKALVMNPARADVATLYCHIGMAYRAEENFSKALEILETAREHDGSLKEIYQQLGFCYFKVGKYEKAIEQFEKALEIDPGSAMDYANIGANVKAMGNDALAMSIYEIALEIDPGLEFARSQLDEIRAAQRS